MDISPEFNIWQPVDVPPLKPGIYWVKIKPIKGLPGHFISHYRTNPLELSEKLEWEVERLKGFIVTHWKF